jgi:addiction module HigA family antidote
MAMEDPAHPAVSCLPRASSLWVLMIRDAAAALFVSRTNLSGLVNGKRCISPAMAVRLSRVFGGSAASWLTQQVQYDLAHVRADHIKLKRLELV